MPRMLSVSRCIRLALTLPLFTETPGTRGIPETLWNAHRGIWSAVPLEAERTQEASLPLLAKGVGRGGGWKTFPPFFLPLLRIKRSQGTSCSETQWNRTHPNQTGNAIIRNWPITTQYSWHWQKKKRKRVPFTILLSGHSYQIIVKTPKPFDLCLNIPSLCLSSSSQSYTLGSRWDDKGLGNAGESKLATSVCRVIEKQR